MVKRKVRPFPESDSVQTAMVIESSGSESFSKKKSCLKIRALTSRLLRSVCECVTGCHVPKATKPLSRRGWWAAVETRATRYTDTTLTTPGPAPRETVMFHLQTLRVELLRPEATHIV